MNSEYDFSHGKRGVFYRPGTRKRYVITLEDHPPTAVFEISQNDAGGFEYVLKATDGEILLSRGSFGSREEAMESIEELRARVISASIGG